MIGFHKMHPVSPIGYIHYQIHSLIAMSAHMGKYWTLLVNRSVLRIVGEYVGLQGTYSPLTDS